MTTITDEQLHLYADRVKGKVVVITGNISDLRYAENFRCGLDRCCEWIWQRNCITICEVWVSPMARDFAKQDMIYPALKCEGGHR